MMMNGKSTRTPHVASFILLLAITICVSAAANAETSIAQQQGVEVIENSPDVQRVRLPTAMAEKMNAASGNLTWLDAYVGKSDRTNELVLIRSLGGLATSSLPAFYQQELLNELGYASWSDVSAEDRQKPISTRIVFIDAIMAADRAGPAVRGICERVRKQKHFDKTVNNSVSDVFNDTEGSVTGSLEASLMAAGKIVGALHYNYKQWCPAPDVNISLIKLDVDLDIEGVMAVNGSASYQNTVNLFRQNFNIYGGKVTFSVFGVPVEIDLKLGALVGAKLDVEASATFDGVFEASGSIDVTYECTGSDCDKTSDNVDLSFNMSESAVYGVQTRITLTPYIDVYAKADVEALFGIFDLVNAQAGLVISAPTQHFFYLGNACGDADADSVNESVDANLLDSTLQLEAYLQFESFNAEYKKTIDLGLDDYEIDFDYSQTDGDFRTTVYRRNLYYEDLVGSSVIEAMISGPDVVSTNSGIMVNKRPCHPFNSAVNFEVDFGDGTIISTTGPFVPHVWNGYGDYIVRARLASDAAHRLFPVRWTTRHVNVSPDGERPVYPWLVPIL